MGKETFERRGGRERAWKKREGEMESESERRIGREGTKEWARERRGKM